MEPYFTAKMCLLFIGVALLFDLALLAALFIRIVILGGKWDTLNMIMFYVSESASTIATSRVCSLTITLHDNEEWCCVGSPLSMIGCSGNFHQFIQVLVQCCFIEWRSPGQTLANSWRTEVDISSPSLLKRHPTVREVSRLSVSKG